MRYRNLVRAVVLSLGLMVALFTLPAVAQTGDQGAGTSGATATQPHHRNPNATDKTIPAGSAADQNTPSAAQTPSSTNPNAATSPSGAASTSPNTPPDQTNPATTQPAGTTTNTSGGSSGGWGLWGLVGLFGLFGLGGGRRRDVAVDETRQDVRRIA